MNKLGNRCTCCVGALLSGAILSNSVSHSMPKAMLLLMPQIKNYLQTGTVMYENEIEEQEAAMGPDQTDALAFL